MNGCGDDFEGYPIPDDPSERSAPVQCQLCGQTMAVGDSDLVVVEGGPVVCAGCALAVAHAWHLHVLTQNTATNLGGE